MKNEKNIIYNEFTIIFEIIRFGKFRFKFKIFINFKKYLVNMII